MKLKNYFFGLRLLDSSLLMGSCTSGTDSKDDVLNSEIGVHKYIIEVTGDEDVQQMFSFAGNTVNSIAKLYDEDGKYLGESYTDVTTIGNKKRIVCKTGDKGSNLFVTYSLYGRECNLNSV